VGWIKDAHGIRGDNYIQLYAKTADWLEKLDQIFLLKPGAADLSAHKVSFKRPHKEGLVLRFSESKDRNYAETLRKSGVYIPADWLETADDDDEFFLGEVEGFKLLDEAGTELGEITGFSSNGVQDILNIALPDGREGLVPFVEAFIVAIDFDAETVTMDLPPGLLDQ